MKQRLLDDKVKLEQDLEDLGTKNKTNPGHYDPARPEYGGNSDDDNAIEVSNFSDDVSILERLEKELQDTIKALTSIEKGMYGVCKYCKKDIDEKRLEARPTSTACIDCKKMLTQEM